MQETLICSPSAYISRPGVWARCPFVLKPASRTPIGALIIGEVLSQAPHMPKGATPPHMLCRRVLDALVTQLCNPALACNIDASLSMRVRS